MKSDGSCPNCHYLTPLTKKPLTPSNICPSCNLPVRFKPDGSCPNCDYLPPLPKEPLTEEEEEGLKETPRQDDVDAYEDRLYVLNKASWYAWAMLAILAVGAFIIIATKYDKLYTNERDYKEVAYRADTFLFILGKLIPFMAFLGIRTAWKTRFLDASLAWACFAGVVATIIPGVVAIVFPIVFFIVRARHIRRGARLATRSGPNSPG